MPEPKPLSTYPLEYFRLFERAASDAVTIPLSSNKEAKRYRNRLYAFKQAVVLDPERAGKVALLIGLVKLRIIGSTIVAEPTEPGLLKERISVALSKDGDERVGSSTRETPSVHGQHDDSSVPIVSGKVQK